MKLVLLIAVPLAALFTLFAWRISTLLSPDAIAMAIGLAFGVFAGLPTAALVLLARRRDGEDDWQPTIIDYPPPPVFSDQVTPYTQLARRAMQLPEFPDRRAEIDMLRAAADYLESEALR